MAITLAEMKVGMDDKIAEQVVDTFLRNSEILQLLPFDNCVCPDGTGSTLTYGYVQTKIPSTAAFRTLNNEYTAAEATVEEKNVTLKIFGGSFEMDRVLKEAEGKYNSMAFQLEQKIKSAISLFHYTLINGDATTNTQEFDGLDKQLASTSTEYNASGCIDISTMSNLTTNADALYEAIQILVNNTNADALLMNTAMLSKIQTLARKLGYRTETEEAFGKKVVSMDGVKLIDLQKYYTVSSGTVTGNDCVKSGITRTISSTSTSGLTDIYAVRFDVNEGFHAATLTGNSVIQQYLPNFNEPGAVKKGEVEMVAATVLKNTSAAGVLRNIKIA